jgi:hypothetical protein
MVGSDGAGVKTSFAEVKMSNHEDEVDDEVTLTRGAGR